MGSVRWVVVAVLAGHGLIHLLGVAKAFGWAEVSELEQPIGPGGDVVWLLAAVLVLASAVLIAAGPRRGGGRSPYWLPWFPRSPSRPHGATRSSAPRPTSFCCSPLPTASPPWDRPVFMPSFATKPEKRRRTLALRRGRW